MQPRVVFMGTPEFAVPSLRELARHLGSAGLLVVTQPDRAAGRGRRLQPPPVKVNAEELGLDVIQVHTLKDPSVRERLVAHSPDLIVVAAFGRILPAWVLNLPTRGCVNLHASLLPRFRGASPIAAAVACGDDRTGVALMEMEPGLDTGPVFDMRDIAITHEDTTESLTGRLSVEAATLIGDRLDALLRGQLTPLPQRGEVVETRKIEKAHGAVDWHQPAVDIERHVRAMWSWPRAWTVAMDNTRIQIHAAEVESSGSGPPGIVLGHDARGLTVATGDEALRLLTVQLAGKSAQPAAQLAQHPALAVGSQLSAGADFVPPEPWVVWTGEV